MSMMPSAQRRSLLAALATLALQWAPGPGHAAAALRLATTTSTENSGLLAAILPKFEAASGLRVQVIAVGTG